MPVTALPVGLRLNAADIRYVRKMLPKLQRTTLKSQKKAGMVYLNYLFTNKIDKAPAHLVKDTTRLVETGYRDPVRQN